MRPLHPAMTFSNLSGLWLLAALAPLVVLYLLKVERTTRRVSSTWLWQAARRDVLAKSPFQRLYVQIPLLLQLAALVFLAIALAGPATRHRAILGDHVAIIVDASASMSTVDDKTKKPRIELAKDGANAALSALSPGADAMVLEAAREPRLASALDRDAKRLHDAIDHISARDVEGDLGAAVALAADRLRQLGGSRRILVFTDGALAHPDALAESSLPLEVYIVGSNADNTAIVRVDVRSGTDQATHEEEVQAFALVANLGSRPRDVFVTLRLSTIESPLASRRIVIAPGERAPVLLTFHPTPGDRGKGLLIETSPRDAMAVDDVAYARVPAGAKLPVALVASGPSPWLTRALTSDPDVELWKGKPEDIANAKVGAGGLWVYDGYCPSELPTGDFMVFSSKTGRCVGVDVKDAIAAPTITSWNHGDARLRFLTLDGVHLAHASPLATESALQDLVRGPHDALMADVSAPGRTGTLVGFDPGDSDWPLKASFVLFIRNSIELARAHRAQGAMSAVHAGEPLRMPVPADVTEIEVVPPGKDDAVKLPARSGLAVVSDTDRAGLYLVSWKGARPGSVLVPVNLASERESDLAPKSPLAVAKSGASVASVTELADAHTDWSWLVALLALVFLVIDVLWLTRVPKKTNTRVLAPRLPERRAA